MSNPTEPEVPEDLEAEHSLSQATHGDTRMAAQLKQGFEKMADSVTDEDLAEKLRGAAAGKIGLRDLVMDPGFGRLVSQGMEKMEAEQAELTPEEQAAQDEQVQKLAADSIERSDRRHTLPEMPELWYEVDRTTAQRQMARFQTEASTKENPPEPPTR
ncbi:MAG: hypothetical protein ACTH2Q_07995 [Propionibacteriaceae bacterium]